MIARTLLRPVIAPMLRGFTVTGGERLPDGPAIVACNHPAHIDSLYLLTALPRLAAVVGARPHHFDGWLRRAVLALGDVQCVPDEAAFHRIGGAWLATGSPILAYPERTTHPDALGPFLPWVARLALVRAVPILPCHLRGTAPSATGPVRLAIGAPLPPTGDDTSLTAALHRAITELGAA